jgi:hypothetical protein
MYGKDSVIVAGLSVELRRGENWVQATELRRVSLKDEVSLLVVVAFWLCRCRQAMETGDGVFREGAAIDFPRRGDLTRAGVETGATWVRKDHRLLDREVPMYLDCVTRNQCPSLPTYSPYSVSERGVVKEWVMVKHIASTPVPSEFVGGELSARRVQNRRRGFVVGREEVVRLLMGAVDGVRGLHEWGWCSRDVRLANMVTYADGSGYGVIDLENGEALSNENEVGDYRAVGLLLLFYTNELEDVRLRVVYLCLALGGLTALRSFFSRGWEARVGV